MAEIVFIATYRELAELAEQVSRQLGVEIEVQVGRRERGVELARQAEARGAEVLISRGITAWDMRTAGVALPVVDVPITGYDVIRAYFAARKHGGPIGIVDIPEVIRGVESLETIMGEKIRKYVLRDPRDIERGVVQVRAEGARVIIGTITSARAAEASGMNAVMIDSGREAVAEAIEEAVRVLGVRKREKERTEQFRAILDYAYDGIIAIDGKGLITAFNPVAEKILGINAADALGRPAASVVPNTRLPEVLRSGRPELGELQEVGKAKIVTNRVPIMVQKRTVGVVATFQEVSQLQRLEHNVRRKLADRGHVAKYTFDDILGTSPRIREAVAKARKFAGVDSTILICAETGTGKEIFAHAIHQASAKRNGPLVAVNCAALPENLLESELFGYADGAFTGARKGGKPGLFELAHGGTIFLDEIGEMSERVQARLLRVLESQEVMRLGDDRVLPVNVRVIAATNRELKQMVREHQFRDDLYYRINVLKITIPPLRERREDIPVLAQRFVNEFSARFGKRIAGFTNEALQLITGYDWPGNVRELRNIVERLVILTETSHIEGQTVAEVLAEAVPLRIPRAAAGEDALKAVELNTIRRVLQEVGGNKTRAARVLGIGRTTLWRKLGEDGDQNGGMGNGA